MPFAPLVMMAVYLGGALIMVPVTVLIVVTVIVFGPVMGAVYALMGTAVGTVAGYGVGRVAGRDAVRRLGGRRLNALSRQIGNHGLLAMVVLRLMPLAPFTLVNLVVGASRIRLRDCLLGTLIGMSPGILVAAALVDRVAALAQRPSGFTAALLAAVLWETAKQIFRWYILSFGVYDQVYGPLGVLVALAMFAYYSGVVFILGAEFAAALMTKGRRA